MTQIISRSFIISNEVLDLTLKSKDFNSLRGVMALKKLLGILIKIVIQNMKGKLI